MAIIEGREQVAAKRKSHRNRGDSSHMPLRSESGCKSGERVLQRGGFIVAGTELDRGAVGDDRHHAHESVRETVRRRYSGRMTKRYPPSDKQVFGSDVDDDDMDSILRAVDKPDSEEQPLRGGRDSITRGLPTSKPSDTR